MSTQKLDTEIRREQIVKAAVELLGTCAVGELSMAMIARRVGLVPSAIYRHFEGREAVLDAVLDSIGDRLQENLRLVEQEPEVLPRLKSLLMRHVRFVRENQAIPRTIFSDEIVTRNPGRRQKVCKIIQSYLHGVAEIVREGQARGEIRKSVDATTIAMQFLGIVQPGAILWHLSDGEFDITRHARRAWEHFRNSIAAESH
jgi:AcrR family transcriptional regulator